MAVERMFFPTTAWDDSADLANSHELVFGYPRHGEAATEVQLGHCQYSNKLALDLQIQGRSFVTPDGAHLITLLNRKRLCPKLRQRAVDDLDVERSQTIRLPAIR